MLCTSLALQWRSRCLSTTKAVSYFASITGPGLCPLGPLVWPFNHAGLFITKSITIKWRGVALGCALKRSHASVHTSWLTLLMPLGISLDSSSSCFLYAISVALWASICLISPNTITRASYNKVSSVISSNKINWWEIGCASIIFRSPSLKRWAVDDWLFTSIQSIHFIGNRGHFNSHAINVLRTSSHCLFPNVIVYGEYAVEDCCSIHASLVC